MGTHYVSVFTVAFIVEVKKIFGVEVVCIPRNTEFFVLFKIECVADELRVADHTLPAVQPVGHSVFFENFGKRNDILACKVSRNVCGGREGANLFLEALGIIDLVIELESAVNIVFGQYGKKIVAGILVVEIFELGDLSAIFIIVTVEKSVEAMLNILRAF